MRSIAIRRALGLVCMGALVVSVVACASRPSHPTAPYLAARSQYTQDLSAAKGQIFDPAFDLHIRSDGSLFLSRSPRTSCPYRCGRVVHAASDGTISVMLPVGFTFGPTEDAAWSPTDRPINQIEFWDPYAHHRTAATHVPGGPAGIQRPTQLLARTVAADGFRKGASYYLPPDFIRRSSSGQLTALSEAPIMPEYLGPADGGYTFTAHVVWSGGTFTVCTPAPTFRTNQGHLNGVPAKVGSC